MRRVGYAPGAFDLFHIGHLNLLRRARSMCDYLIAGVVTDDVLTAVKGRPPVIPLSERIDVVASMRDVDEVVIDPFLDKAQMWPALQFDVLFKGDDWRGTERGDLLEVALAGFGAVVEYFPYTRTISSSSLRALISSAA